MAKKRNRKDKNNIKKIETVGGLDGDLKHVIGVISIIIIIFCLFYGLTILLTRDGSSKQSNNSGSIESSISYTDIMLGRSFSMPEEEYLVLYYDKDDSELVSSFATAVSNYRSGENNYTLYTVDMSNSFNKAYISTDSNNNPTAADQLAINGPTLIHFSKGNVVNYIEGVDSILAYIK